MNDKPTLAERLEKVGTGRLYVRRSLASTALVYGQTAEARAKALDEIEAIDSELQRRGEAAPTCRST
jgi:hypothetical protein